MKLIKTIRALSNLSIIILLLTSLVVGALASYLWVMGYYLTLGLKVPADAALTISDISFANQSTSYLNVTFFNPSYSKDANIIRIAAKTVDDKIHNMTQTSPETPYTIRRASDLFDGKITFKCTWDWANYTGQDIVVLAFINEGSGPTRRKETPLVDLEITEAVFNSSISVTHFNLTIQNSGQSVTYVNISQIIPSIEVSALTQISPTLPYKLDRGQTKTFKCIWDWTNYQNKSITITVRTAQGYTAYYPKTTPLPLGVNITDVIFSEPDTNNFNVTVKNKKESPAFAFVNITKITVTLENGTVREIDRTQIKPTLPYQLNRNLTQSFQCTWNWTLYRGKNVIVTVFTAQNYTFSFTKATPSPIEITGTIFDPADTNNFNVTVRNSALYPTYVRITAITLTFENGTVKEMNGTAVSPLLPRNLIRGESVSFRCPWNWTAYQGRNVTITVRTVENGVAQFVKVTPKRVILTIASISFDSVNTGIFNVTVRNSALSLENANITKVTVTLENGTVKEISSISPSLPYLLSPNSTTEFTCQWDWTNYRGKNITITIYTAKGYMTFSLYTTPPE